MIGDRFDPYRAFKFSLAFEGKTRAGFRECFGLTPPTDSPRPKLPGRIHLRQGMTADPAFCAWHATAASRDGVLIVREISGRERFRCRISAARITKWAGPELSPGEDEVSIETIELAHDGIELDRG